MKILGIIVLIAILFVLFKPAYTKKIQGENSISEYRKIDINGEKIQVLIRGHNKDNPILVFVHGGPCCSEIPYVRKYQDELEKDFNIL